MASEIQEQFPHLQGEDKFPQQLEITSTSQKYSKS